MGIDLAKDGRRLTEVDEFDVDHRRSKNNPSGVDRVGLDAALFVICAAHPALERAV